MHTLGRRITIAIALGALALPLAAAGSAAADQAPLLSCGTTQPGQCSQTAHFTDNSEFLTPLPNAPATCPIPAADYGALVGTGHGVEHATVNNAQDAWFTSTFTGTATITLYPPSSVTVDNQGNVTGIVGPPDSNVPVLTGKMTEWFGGAFNNKNSTFGGTTNFELGGGGQSVSIHVVFRAVWTPGANPNGPPTHSVQHVTCS